MTETERLKTNIQGSVRSVVLVKSARVKCDYETKHNHVILFCL